MLVIKMGFSFFFHLFIHNQLMDVLMMINGACVCMYVPVCTCVRARTCVPERVCVCLSPFLCNFLFTLTL